VLATDAIYVEGPKSHDTIVDVGLGFASKEER
jgi:hypothetical protein